MARIQFRIDKKSNGNHSGKAQSETTGSGSFLVTWDTADISSETQIRAAFEAFLQTAFANGSLTR